MLRAELALTREQFDAVVEIAGAAKIGDDGALTIRRQRLMARAHYGRGRLENALRAAGEDSTFDSPPPPEGATRTDWPIRAPDDGRAATILIAGAERSGLEDWCAAFDSHARCAVLADGTRRADRHDLFSEHVSLGNLDSLTEATWRLQRRRYWQNVVRRLTQAPVEDERIIDAVPLDPQVLRRARRFFPGSLVLLCVRHPRAVYIDARLRGYGKDSALTRATDQAGWLAFGRALDLNVILLRHEDAADQLAPTGSVWPHLSIAGADVRSAFREATERRRGLAAYPPLANTEEAKVLFSESAELLDSAAHKARLRRLPVI